MKKVYSIPTVELIQLTTVAMISTSSPIDTETEIPGTQDSNRNRGEWGNVWAN